jgi:hypothetical protein
VGSGSGSSTTFRALSGPDSSTIWMARIAGIMAERGGSGATAGWARAPTPGCGQPRRGHDGGAPGS